MLLGDPATADPLWDLLNNWFDNRWLHFESVPLVLDRSTGQLSGGKVAVAVSRAHSPLWDRVTLLSLTDKLTAQFYRRCDRSTILHLAVSWTPPVAGEEVKDSHIGPDAELLLLCGPDNPWSAGTRLKVHMHFPPPLDTLLSPRCLAIHSDIFALLLQLSTVQWWAQRVWMSGQRAHRHRRGELRMEEATRRVMLVTLWRLLALVRTVKDVLLGGIHGERYEQLLRNLSVCSCLGDMKRTHSKMIQEICGLLPVTWTRDFLVPVLSHGALFLVLAQDALAAEEQLREKYSHRVNDIDLSTFSLFNDVMTCAESLGNSLSAAPARLREEIGGNGVLLNLLSTSVDLFATERVVR